MSMFEHIKYSVCSDKGLVRGNNEDLYLVMPEEGVFAVADGMGGGSAGELASAMLCEKLQKALADTADESPGLRKYNAQQAMHAANDAVLAYAAEHKFDQMGTTLVLFLLDPWYPDRALLCHIGDSRAYLLRKKELRLLTEDHNVGATMPVRRGLFSGRLSEAEEHSRRLLTRAVGISRQVLPEWKTLELRPGDRLLLCTDGLTSMVDDKEIADVMRRFDTPEDIVASLRQRILKAGAVDNFTLVCLQLAVDLPSAATPEQAEMDESDYLMQIAEWRKDHA